MFKLGVKSWLTPLASSTVTKTQEPSRVEEQNVALRSRKASEKDMFA